MFLIYIAYSEPHFKTGDLVVDEFVSSVMVCAVGGVGGRRTLAIYTATGPNERCPNRPCNPASGIYIATCLCVY